MVATAVGIDYGTNNSAIVALPPNGTPMPVKSVEGDSLIPSAIYYPEKSGEKILVGRPALAKLPSRNVIRSPKRGVGITLFVCKKKGLMDAFNAKVAETAVTEAKTTKRKGATAAAAADKEREKSEKAQRVRFLVTTDGETKELAVETVVADMLKYMVELTEAAHGKEVKFTFSRPQYYGPTQCEVFKNAVHSAIGGPDRLVEIVTEPNAAMFAYHAQPGATEKKRGLVLDIGGGTFDISFLERKAPGLYQGQCTGGDDFLGGSDMDRELLSTLQTEMKREKTFKPDTFEERRAEFLGQLKDMKHNLSMTDSARIVIYGCTDKPFTFEVDTQKKEKIFAKFYKALETAITECFERKVKNMKKTADELKKEVQMVYFVGGPTRDASLCEIFQNMFPDADLIGKPGTRGALNPDDVVAHGCVFWCAAKEKTSPKIGLPPEPYHRGVLSKSLGVEGVMPDGNGGVVARFYPIIEANTQLPACKGQGGFGTSEDNQDSAYIKVYQGEGEFIDSEGMQEIGTYSVPLEKPNYMNEVSISIEMEVKNNNQLIVHAGQKGQLKRMEFDFQN